MTNLTNRIRAALHDRYEIDREIGHGGMATVFLARDVKHDRPVAVKLLNPELAASIGSDSTFTLAHLWLGQALEMMGRRDESLVALRRALAQSGEGAIFVAALAHLHATRGERAEAERLVRGLEARANPPAFEIAKVHFALGRSPEGFRWLERAFAERSHSMVLLRVDPQLRTLRNDPSFERLAKRVGL